MTQLRVIETATRSLEAPVLFPVNNTGLKGEGNGPPYWLEIPDMKTMLLNAHLLKKSSIYDTILRKGLHDHYSKDGVFFVDSGGLQQRLHNIKLDPLEILRIQENIGADIAATLDIPIFPEDDTLSSLHSRNISVCVKNALLCLENREREDMKIYASIQGNDIKIILNIIDYLQKKGNFDGYAIGGLLPKRSDFRQIIDIIFSVRKRIGTAPLHVFGLGGPSYIPLLSYIGVDSFDSSSYMKAGSNRIYFIPGQGSNDLCNIGNQEWLPCVCPVCSNKTAVEIRSERKLIALHNLWAITFEIRRLKVAIQENTLEKYLDGRFQSNPLIHSAFRYARSKKRGFV